MIDKEIKEEIETGLYYWLDVYSYEYNESFDMWYLYMRPEHTKVKKYKTKDLFIYLKIKEKEESSV